MVVQGYQSLEVWQKAISLVTDIYSITKQFPKEEVYSLTSQIRRAAISIPSNIAEGKAKRSPRDFMRFISIARGSVAELETQLIISHNLAYISADQLNVLLEQIGEIGRMTAGLHTKLETSLAANT